MRWVQTAQNNQMIRLLTTNSDYFLLWLGQFISLTGTGVTQVAFPLLILFISRSPQQAGIVSGIGLLPYFFLSLPIGAMIDRVDRKRVMILCDIGRFIILLSIPIAIGMGRLTIWQIYIVVLIEGTLFVVFNIAEISSLARVVKEEQLVPASSLNATSDGLSSLIGPTLAGIIFGISISLPFLFDALSYAVSVLTLGRIRTNFQEEKTVQVDRKLISEISFGIQWLWKHKSLRYLALYSSTINFSLAGSTLVIIISAQNIGASSVIIGLLFTVGGIGAILGSLVSSVMIDMFGMQKLVPLVCGVFFITWTGFAFANNFMILFFLTFILLGIVPIFNVAQVSYRLSLIPDELQGRVNSVFRLIAIGLTPLGMAITGILIQHIHLQMTVLIFSLCLLLLEILVIAIPWMSMQPRSDDER